jgi:hypothetical protein
MNIASVATARFGKSLDRIVVKTQILSIDYSWYVCGMRFNSVFIVTLIKKS